MEIIDLKNMMTTLRYLLSGYVLKIIIHLDAFGKDNLIGMMYQGTNKPSEANLSTCRLK